MTPTFIEKRERLADPVATTGDQLYIICSQNGLFPTPWSTSHVPHELWGVWAHPIKLLDGFWFAIRKRAQADSPVITSWLLEADACRVYGSHTEFDYRIEPLRVTRRDFVPDGLAGVAVTITVQMPADFADALELVVLVRSDLRPAWLGEQVGMQDAPDRVVVADTQHHLCFRDESNPWVALVGGSTTIQAVVVGDAAGVLQPTVGQGATAQVVFDFQPRTADTVTATLYVAGSVTGEAEALESYARLCTDYGALVQQKETLYAKLAQQTRLQSPQALINQAFHWSKLSGQLLARQTPAHGPAVGAGLPNYPWWFGIDTEYAVLPMLQAGLFDLTKATLRLLKETSTAHNLHEPGRVIHELSTTGIVYNPGNLVETPAFTRAVYQTWRWTGDRAFLEEMYPFCKQGVLDYTLGRCDPDGDLCPAGRSIIETLEMHADFECIDVASYTWDALLCLAEMARAVGDMDTIDSMTTKAATLAECIREEWWLPAEGLFADVRASVQEVTAALHRIDGLQSDPGWPGMAPQAAQAHRLFDAQVEARANRPQAVDLPWLLRHWVVMCPLEVGLATPAQAERTFTRLLSPEFCNEWGMYLHPERREVMSINTGLLALALMRYGRVNEAINLVEQMAATLTLRTPGAISEALPDQWCFLQLWSALGIISPIVAGVLGVEPNAGARQLQVTPHLPADWPAATLEQVQVGEKSFTLHTTRSETEYRLTVQAETQVGVQDKGQEYALTVGFYIPSDKAVVSVRLNGASSPWRWETTSAGRRLLCNATGQAELIVTVTAGAV